MYFVGIDVGGTNIAAGVVDENYKIVATAKIKTRMPRPAEQIIDDIALSAKQAVANAGLTMDDIESIGVGCPGQIDFEKGVVNFSPNLDFHLVPLKAMLEERLNKKIFIENDANAAAFGEVLAGAAKNTKNAVIITLGTGVGGGIIIDGKIYRGHNYAGAEPGHMVIKESGVRCGCGRRGCFEQYASATALIRQTRDAMRRDPHSLMWKLTGGDLKKVTGHTAFDAMRKGDQTAKRVVKKYIDYIGCGIVNLINIFQPEILCIGGGICNEGEELMAPLRAYIERERFSRYCEVQTKLGTTSLLNDAGIIGAAFLHLSD